MRSPEIASFVETSSRSVVVGDRAVPAPAVPYPSACEPVSREIRLPHYCARCLAEPEGNLVVEQCERRGSESTRSSVRVPMCSRCLGEVRGQSRRAVEALAHCSIAGVVLAVFVWSLTSWVGAAWPAALGPVIGVMLCSLYRNRAAICSFDAAGPFFENAQYQLLFERLNGLDRSDYSPFARLSMRGAGYDDER